MSEDEADLKKVAEAVNEAEQPPAVNAVLVLVTYAENGKDIAGVDPQPVGEVRPAEIESILGVARSVARKRLGVD